MEESKHLHTHAHKTRTYWTSQANNKLIWAISVLCGGTKQQDKMGAAASSLRWGPPTIFSYPHSLTLQVRGRVDTRKRVLVVAGTSNSQQITGGKRDEKCLFCYNKKTLQYLALVYFLQCMITVRSDMVSTVTIPQSPPWQTSTPTSSLSHRKTSCQTLCVDPIMCPTGHLGRGRIIPRVKYGEMNA